MIRKFFSLGIITITLLGILLVVSDAKKVNADQKVEYLVSRVYELNKETTDSEKFDKYIYSKSDVTSSSLCLGKATLFGTFKNVKKVGDYYCYSASDIVSIGYQYNGERKNDDTGDWIIESDGQKEIYLPELGENVFDNKVDSGAIFILKSYDGEKWDLVTKELYMDFFDNYPNGNENLYTVSKTDIEKGCYFKLLVIHKEEFPKGFGKTNPRRKLIEVSNFCVSASYDTLKLLDVINGSNITNNQSTVYGFSINVDSCKW